MTTLKIKPTKEKDIQAVILQYLNLKGYFCWRTNAGAMKIDNRFIRFSYAPGISDIIGIARDGSFIAIEVKRPGKTTTVTQKAFLKEIEKHRGYAIVATSLDDVEKIL